MTELWGPVIAGIGLMATIVFGIQNELRARYERVLAMLQQLGTGEEVTSRHRLGRYVYGGFPDVSRDDQAALVEDFFIVVSGIRRLRSTLTSVHSTFLPGPERLLLSSSAGMVQFMAQHMADVAANLHIVDVESATADVAAMERAGARVGRRDLP